MIHDNLQQMVEDRLKGIDILAPVLHGLIRKRKYLIDQQSHNKYPPQFTETYGELRVKQISLRRAYKEHCAFRKRNMRHGYRDFEGNAYRERLIELKATLAHVKIEEGLE